ncbi:MAG TPA: phosphotransferase [Chthonomonadaceae bacterium]|nr:phosphotransferase [Chthonomonadaceae bacterium]
MRQPPELSENTLIDCLRTHFDLPVVTCRYLPIGYDMNAFVYEALTAEGDSYFVKVRDGAIPLPSLLVPRLLIEQGISHILAPLRTLAQSLWCSLERYSVIVYPFIHGENAKLVGLSEDQWREFGATLNAIHSGGFAELLRGQVPEEAFSNPAVQVVRRLSARIEEGHFESPAAAELAAFWSERQRLISHLLDRAETLAGHLQRIPFENVLCHADIHGANILVSEEGDIHLVDWDGPLLAPRERDLLFVVGSRIACTVLPHEESWFFEGYGEVEINRTALTYYRYERVIEDIGEASKRAFGEIEASEEVRAEEAEHIRMQFLPGNMLEAALQADTNLG